MHDIKTLAIKGYWADNIFKIDLDLRCLKSSLTLDTPRYKNALKDLRNMEKKLKDMKKTIKEQIKR